MFALIDPKNGNVWHIDEKREYVMEKKMEMCNKKIGERTSRFLWWNFKVVPCEISYEFTPPLTN